MEERSLVVSGSAGETALMRDQLRATLDAELSHEAAGIVLGDVHEQAPGPFSGARLGMEPITYFIVAFSAHLAADYVMELIRRAAAGRGLKSIETHDAD